jgi:SAM-dependent methyltransferase
MARLEELAAGAVTIGALAIADRSGLLAEMAGRGELAIEQLASERFNPRYVEEALAVLAAAGVVEFHPLSHTFSLPDEHAACLTDPASPYLLAGWLDTIPAAFARIDDLAEATKHGGGVPLTRYDDRLIRGIDRLNSPGIRILLARRWLAAMPDVVAKLEEGGRVADIGCGSGAAAETMARAFPNSTVTGYDVDPRAVARAQDRAAASGLTNLRFEVVSGETIPLGFDLITTFDVIHDLSHPERVLSRIREALNPDGTYLMMEPAAGPRLEDNFSPRGTLTYGFSLLYCLPQSLVDNGAGLGAAWGPTKAEELCLQAGFKNFEQLPIDNPYSNFFRMAA